ncbi:MAG: ATP-binding cassette domain-containing protein, partial [Thermomicrobiales bacterium]|nr:ATP-binding cassette domain-containing protein [Thermomicrobiales bacterium]
MTALPPEDVSRGPIVTNDSPLLTVDGVSATFVEQRHRLPVLRDIAFGLQRNEFVSLIGPSGSGKTTLLDIIAGLWTPDSGQILLDGIPTTAAERLGTSAYMHQRDLLLPWRNALDNAVLGLEVQGVAKSRARAIARERFPAFGLQGFEDRYPAQLSGGMRQRVAFL